MIFNFSDIPNHGPYAAAALIVHESGLVLSVSRKFNDNDKGCAGGKLDPGENFVDACIRETKEETGLIVTKLIPIFGAPCGRPERSIVHWNLAFLCKVEGKIETFEKGKVSWVPFKRLQKMKTGEECSFIEYNIMLEKRYKALPDFFQKEWLTTIELDPSKVENNE